MMTLFGHGKAKIDLRDKATVLTPQPSRTHLLRQVKPLTVSHVDEPYCSDTGQSELCAAFQVQHTLQKLFDKKACVCRSEILFSCEIFLRKKETFLLVQAFLHF